MMALKEFKTKYHKWLLQGNHPDTGGTGQNFDRVRQAYHVYVEYLTHLQEENYVSGDPTNYQEFVADALANGNSPLILELYAGHHLRNFIKIGKNNRQHSLLIP